MASNQGPPRRNGVIGFSMSGASAPVRPSTPAPRRNGVIGFNVSGASAPIVPSTLAQPQNGPIGSHRAPDHTTVASRGFNNGTNSQAPPHRNIPLAGPDTAHSFGHANVRVTNNQLDPYQAALLQEASQSNVAINSARKSQREISALTTQLAETESTIARQEMEKNIADAQVLALQAKLANQHKATTRLIDLQQLDVINRANTDRNNQINAQFEKLENQLERIEREFEKAKGNLVTLEVLRNKLDGEMKDWYQLRQVVDSAEVKNRAQQVRLGEGETLLRAILSKCKRLQKEAMQTARECPAPAAGRSSTQSHAPSVHLADQNAPATLPVNNVDTNSPTRFVHRSPVQSPRQFDLSNPFLKEMRPQEPQIHGQQQQSMGRTQQSAEIEESDIGVPKGSKSDFEPSDISMRLRSESPSVRSDIVMRSRSASPSVMSDIVMRSRSASPIVMSDVIESESQRSAMASLPSPDATTSPDAMDCEEEEHERDPYAPIVQTEYKITMEWVPTFPPRKKVARLEAEASDGESKISEKPNKRMRLDDTATITEVPSVVPSIVPAEPREEPRAEPLTHAQASRNRIRSFVHARWAASMIKTVPEMPVVRATLVSESAPSAQVSTEVPTQEVLSPSTVPQPAQIPQEYTENVPTEWIQVEMSVPAIPQPAQAAMESTETAPTEVETNTEMSVPAVFEPAQTVLEPSDMDHYEDMVSHADSSVPAVSQPAPSAEEASETVHLEEVTTHATMSVPMVSQPAQHASGSIETVTTEQVLIQEALSVPAISQPAQDILESTEQVPREATLSAPAVAQPTEVADEWHDAVETMSTDEMPTQAVMSASAVSQPAQTVLEEFNETVLAQQECGPDSESESEYYETIERIERPATLRARLASNRVRSLSEYREHLRTRLGFTPPNRSEIRESSALAKPIRNQTDLDWDSEKQNRRRRPARRLYFDYFPSRQTALTRTRLNTVSSIPKLQVPATSRVSTSSLAATDSRAGVSQGAKRVEGADIPTRSAQKAAGEQRDQLGGEELATGPQMPGAWPADPPVVTASDESDMQEGSAVLKGLTSGFRPVILGALMLVLIVMVSFPLWGDHLGHLIHAVEGPERFLEELRGEHGFEMPFLERLIYAFLRCFAGDRAAYG